MVRCVNEACGIPIEETWAFCPLCGADNRPPENRPEVDCDTHLFVGDGWYCVRCGELRGQSRYDRKLSSVLCMVGGAILVVPAVWCFATANLDPDAANSQANGVYLLAVALILVAVGVAGWFRERPSDSYHPTWRAPWQSRDWHDSND